jgi:hypothetical protein
LLEGKFLFIREHFLNQLINFILSLHSVQKDLTATTLFGESALFRQSARDRVGDGDVGEDQLDIFGNNEAILIKIVSTHNKRKQLCEILSRFNLHVEDKLKFGVEIRVINLEKAMHELLQVYVALTFQVHHFEQALADYTWQLRVL